MIKNDELKPIFNELILTNSSLQKLTERLRVVDVRGLSFTCAPYAEEFEQELPFTRADIGMIVSVEASRAIAGEKLESWRLDPKLTIGIPRHFTEFFYTPEEGAGALKDLMASEPGDMALRERGEALADTLQKTRDYLAADSSDKLLVVHCIRGVHRSPAMALAILFDECPDAPAKDIFRALKTTCVNHPQLRAGELAFVAAFAGRPASVIDEWLEVASPYNNPEGRFNRERAYETYQRYSELLAPQQHVTKQDHGETGLPTRDQVGSPHAATTPRDARM